MNEIENLAMLTIREKENKDVIYGIYLLVNAISSFLITGIIFYFFLRNIEFSAQLILSVGFFFMIYELCQNTRDFSREMNGIFFVYKKFEIVKYIWYNKNGDK